MDKRSVLGFVLIGIVLMVWLYWNSSNQQKAVQNIQQKNDSVNITKKGDEINDPVLKDTVSEKTDSKETTDSLKNDSLVLKYGSIFGNKAINCFRCTSGKSYYN
ncbi:MAG: hypothetical protein R2942_12925 [Ignavibacteria bacterium]